MIIPSDDALAGRFAHPLLCIPVTGLEHMAGHADQVVAVGDQGI